MLRAEGLTFAYPGQTEPYRFDFTVEPAELVTISGESGSGKSTLLDLIAGFQRPSDGALTLDGRDLIPLPPEERPVSILFQANNLFDHLTVDANLRLALKHEPAGSKAISYSLEAMGLAGTATRRAASLSGGQQQRVALARTLLLDRPVLLLDEPFTGLDTETAELARDLVRTTIRDRGWHAILVSHDPADGVPYADRGLRIEDGRLVPQA